ncbi:WD40-repeat-containing domain protein [Tuber indicum]|nr:WD40-repeat-containing domain protein [Tuber indicum]
MARYEDRDRDGGTYNQDPSAGSGGGGGGGGGYDKRGGGGGGGGERDGPYNRGRPLHRRPVTDYGASVGKWMMKQRMNWRGQSIDFLRPAPGFIVDLLPPAAYLENPASSLTTKHIHASLNKIKHPINVVKWTPEGRRLLTGSSSGEFTLWNGMGFNFETIMQAHDCAIRVCQYSHSGDWLLSGDQDGTVKYWQPNFNNVKVLDAHKEPIRDLSFSPTDAKFVTASDDGTLRIWNFNEGVEERALTGHGWDVKSVDWHPTKGLIVSGSKDHLVKLWDPRTSRCLTTLHGHKNTISKSLFQPTRGDLLATCARDQTCRIFDLRAMKDFCVLRGHEKDISTLAWHPIHPALISTGGSDGALNHYLLDESPQGVNASHTSSTIIHPAASIPFAHEYAIWSMEYHPLGHILCSGSNDRITRFWTRPRPATMSEINEMNPIYAPFFGMAGVASAMIFSSMGAAYGTAKAGIAISGIGTFKSELIMKSLISVIMSGIIAVYGLVIAVLIAGDLGRKESSYSLFSGIVHLAAGLSVGLTGLAAGYAIGLVGNAGSRAFLLQPKVFVGQVLILIFAEVLGLYGLIVALILNTKISR